MSEAPAEPGLQSFIFTHISGPVSRLFAAFVRDFVLVLSRMTVLVLVFDCNQRFDYEHEHHFIEHEHDGSQKDVGKDEVESVRHEPHPSSRSIASVMSACHWTVNHVRRPVLFARLRLSFAG